MSLEDLLDQPLQSWMAGGGENSDVVLSSRVRLARNLDKVPFPNRSYAEHMAGVLAKLKQSVTDLSQADNKPYLFLEMQKLQPLERYVLVEKHIISPNLAQEPDNRGLIVREDAAVSIMINEEDHIRIQSLYAGLNLNDALDQANKVDDIIEQKNDLAFSDNMGYLTACPTNLGTGLRASVMMHLPGMTLTGQINRMIAATTQLGLAVRGLYGEGSESAGNIFQISNQLSLGYNEQEIVENIYGVVRQVVDQERAARAYLMRETEDALTDRIYRALGLLRYAHIISGQEALAKLSEVRLGIDLGIIKDIEPKLFNKLLVITRPNYLQKMAGNKCLEAVERDKVRAQVIRDTLAGGV